MRSAISLLAAIAALVAPSQTVINATVNSQVRLAYAGDTGMFVSWNTFSKLGNPIVKYGLTPNSMNQSASSNVFITYQTSLTYHNHVKVIGLEPGTTYYYAPSGLLKDNATSLPYTFRISRSAGDGTPYAVAVVVDMGTLGAQGLTTLAGKGVASTNVLAVNETNTIQSLTAVKNSFEFLWHLGDIAACADYWLKEKIQGFLPNTTSTTIADEYKVYESILNDFYDKMTTTTTSKSYMVGPGNHESNCDNGETTDSAKGISYNASICMPGQTNVTGYINHFRIPSTKSNGTGNFWYSFDHGMVHYIQLDTETDLGHGYIGNDETGGVRRRRKRSLQIINERPNELAHSRSHRSELLENALGHRGWSSTMGPLRCQHIRAIDQNELNNPSSPWYITNGAAGHYDGLDALQVPYQKYQRVGFDTTNTTYGWSRVTFHICTRFTHDFSQAKNGSVLDTATLFKNRTCAARRSLNDSAVSNGTTSPKLK